ncbi:MAG TPA: 4-hydroxy-tetrahydrodipicolinate synthase [Candidatus Krumholzibacteria bacterium]|nr:4-hydroxy-tetrahydrodipicolinate synthase [Candidatus Krumholzibacteria bacterium]HRX52035.1 4-hydroxy-tetrahydrodipicolinate synthase [Candidatus Krumholzibacteria bacterium]
MTERLTLPEGVYTALITPFTPDGALDRDAWRRLVERQLRAGVAGLVPVGCTGEAAALSLEEREWLVRTTVEMAAGGCCVLAGSGTNVTAGTIDLTRRAVDWGADACMLISPYYNKPQQHGLIAHYAAAARSVDVPIVLYNVPGRTSVNILPQTAAALAAEPTIAAVKEASGDLTQIRAMVDTTGLQVFSGDDGLNQSIFALGAAGTVSVLSNLAPAALVRQWRAWRDGDTAAAEALQKELDPIIDACFAETNPVPVKWMLADLGLCEADARLPLAPALPATCARLRAVVEGPLAAVLGEDR